MTSISKLFACKLTTLGLLAGVAAVTPLAPAVAAENASIQGVSPFIDGACTAASPTQIGLRFKITGTVDDTGTGSDRFETHILDSTNAVVWSNSGAISTALGGERSFNAFQLQVGTPVDAPFTAIVVDSTESAKIFNGGDVVDLSDPRILATGQVDMNAIDSDCPGAAPDTTAPRLASIERSVPAAQLTNADSLVWRVTFDEDVQGVDAADFAVSGSSASATAVNAVSASVYDVTASGGDLASFNGTVGLSISTTPTIQDTSANALTNIAATGATESYTLDNTAPGVTLTNGVPDQTTGVFQVTATFSEDVTGFALGDLTVGNGAASNFNATSATVYTATITPTALGVVTVDVAADAAQDGANNNNTAATQLSVDTTPDTTPPTVTASTTASSPVNAAFGVRLTVSEVLADSSQVDTSKFIVTGGTFDGNWVWGADQSVIEFQITPTVAGTLTLELDSGAITDDAGNPNAATSGLFSIAVVFDSTPPTVELTTTATSPVAGAFDVTATFSEDVTGFDGADLQVTNGAASNLQMVSASVYTATITPAADGDVTITIPAGAAQDGAGNPSEAATALAITNDQTAPTVALSTSSPDPVSGSFTLTATFSEAVTGFEVADFTVANGAASNFSASSATVYTAQIAPAADGDVTVDVAAGAAQDAAGNASAAAAQFTIGFDGTAPTVALSTSSSDPVSGAFTITATFSEAVTGFEMADFTVANGAASNFVASSATVYTAQITPAADGDVTVDVAAGAAQDAAGNASAAAAQFTIGFDGTAPTTTVSLPGATAEGPFTATITFSEGVQGFDLADIAVTNGAASALTMTGAGVYTVTITPETVGELTVAVAAGAAQDGAGNASEAGSASLNVEFPSSDVDLDLSATVLDPTGVGQAVTLNNPGSAPLAFTASVDVPWATVDPTSGTIPGSGSLDFTITLTPEADNLEPGDYLGMVTVSTAPSAGTASADTASTGATIVATIPVAVAVAPRFGSLQIVATTPGGLQGDETFTYASSDSDLNGLSLTTSGGTASSAAFRKIFGTYDLAQSLPQGWALDSLTCAGDTDGGSVIDVQAGTADIDLDADETIVCTFANTRDEAAIRLATMRAINNFMVRRADRILSEAPDLSTRLRDRQSTTPGRFSADVDGGNVQMNFAGSLSGLRNHAKANERQMPGGPDTAQPDESRFDVWFAASYTAIDDDRAGDAADSSFGLFQIGADWLVSDNALVGLMLQVDQMDETQDNVVEAAGAIAGAELDGTGWMAGPYAVWEVAPGTTLDVLALWGQSDNTINPLGFYKDDFETTRYMLRANLTGEWTPEASGPGQLTIRPGLAWAHFEETQDAYTDSLGIAIPEQTISIGRFEAGPEVAYRMDGAKPGSWWEPNARLRAVWDYDASGLMDETGRIVDTEGVRADASVGLRGQWSNGAVVSAEARFSGLGEDDFSTNGARLELRMPF